MRSFICRMTTRLSTAIATSSKAPMRKPKSSLRWTPAFTRATASTSGRSQPVKRGIFGSAGVITWSRAISSRRSQRAVIGSIRRLPSSALVSLPRRIRAIATHRGFVGVSLILETRMESWIERSRWVAPACSSAMSSAAVSGQHTRADLSEPGRNRDRADRQRPTPSRRPADLAGRARRSAHAGEGRHP